MLIMLCIENWDYIFDMIKDIILFFFFVKLILFVKFI